MASGPITSWATDGEKLETVIGFIFLRSKITVDGDCSHKIKRCLLLENKAMTHLDSILKNRDIILPTNIHIVRAVVFPVVIHRCESWSVKKAEHWRIDTFKLLCWRRLLGVSWTMRRSNQSILKEINPEYSLEGLVVKSKLQYFGHLIWSIGSLEKTLLLRKIEGKRRRGQERMRWLDNITESMDMSLTTSLKRSPAVHGITCSPWSHKEWDTIQWLNNNNKHWSISFHICKMDNIIIPALNFLFIHIFFIGVHWEKTWERYPPTSFYFVSWSLYFVCGVRWGKNDQGCFLFIISLHVCVCVSVCLTDHPNVAKYIYSLCSLSLTKQHSFQEIVF